MSMIKDAMYYTILFQDQIEDLREDGELVGDSLELTYEMAKAIKDLEYELALYKAGCTKEDVDKLMKQKNVA